MVVRQEQGFAQHRRFIMNYQLATTADELHLTVMATQAGL
jgi:hypothetical protein